MSNTPESILSPTVTITFRSATRHLNAKVFVLQEQLNLALAKRYAASSEKHSPDQIYLFDEAEADVDEGRETAPDDHERALHAGLEIIPAQRIAAHG